jgi:hypothetical protein
MTDAAFFRLEDGLFIGNDPARSPWFAEACHGGPVLMLIARGLQSVLDDKQLVRVTVTFQRPVPMGGIRVESHVERSGRASASAKVVLRDTKGRVCATGEGLFITTGAFGELPTPTVERPVFEQAQHAPFPVQQAVHGLPYFGNCVEVAFPPGESPEHGPGTMWMRTVPLLPEEEPTPFQSACPIADCGNGIGRNASFEVASFVNPDVTIALHRLPRSRWLASQAISHWQPTGVGLSQATLFDETGPVGVALQSLIVRPTKV